MARTLLVTLAITVDHLEGEELEISQQGAGVDADDEVEDDIYPAGNDSDLDETSPEEIAELIADHLPHVNEELWGGSGIYARLSEAEVRSAKWER